MWLKKKKEAQEINIIQSIYKKDRLVRYAQFVAGVLCVAIAFNLFILPTKIVYGMNGIGVICNSIWGVDSSIVILCGNILLLLLSCLLLGVDKTKNSVLGSLCVPIFIKLTAFLPAYMSIPMDDPLLMTLFGAAMTGFGLGLVFKSGFTTGGTDILNQIVSKYAHMSIGSSMIFTDGLIILAGIFAFGWIQLMYSVISPPDDNLRQNPRDPTGKRSPRHRTCPAPSARRTQRQTWRPPWRTGPDTPGAAAAIPRGSSHPDWKTPGVFPAFSTSPGGFPQRSRPRCGSRRSYHKISVPLHRVGEDSSIPGTGRAV